MPRFSISSFVSLYFQKRDLQSSLDEQGYLKKYFDSKKLFSENQLYKCVPFRLLLLPRVFT